MKRSLLFVCLLCLTIRVFSQQAKQTDILYGVFDGRTPCQELASQIEEKTTAECTKIKWRLALYKDSLTGEPTIYKMIGFVYKRDKPRIGAWKITKGSATDPEAVIYELSLSGKPPILLLEGDKNILLFLDTRKNIYVGNKDFSFALNRVNKEFR